MVLVPALLFFCCLVLQSIFVYFPIPFFNRYLGLMDKLQRILLLWCFPKLTLYPLYWLYHWLFLIYTLNYAWGFMMLSNSAIWFFLFCSYGGRDLFKSLRDYWCERLIIFKVSYTWKFSYSAILHYDFFLGHPILYSHSWLSTKNETLLGWNPCVFVMYKLQNNDKYRGNQSRRSKRTLGDIYTIL